MDETYLKNLQDFEHHYCSDEFGQCLYPVFEHSMHSLVKTELSRLKKKWNMPAYQLKNKWYVENDGAVDGSMLYYGPVLWFQGSMTILNGCGETTIYDDVFKWKKQVDGCPEFQPRREILFYHRVTKNFDLFQKLPLRIAMDIVEDMLKFGFILPTLVPLFSRHICSDFGPYSGSTAENMLSYKPFHCFNKETFSRTIGNRTITKIK